LHSPKPSYICWVIPSHHPLWWISPLRTPLVLLGRPNNSFRFLVFFGFRNLLEHSVGFFSQVLAVLSLWAGFPQFFKFSVLFFIFVFRIWTYFQIDFF
jgi:hypothetical protein